jgi:hypothetical protein
VAGVSSGVPLFSPVIISVKVVECGKNTCGYCLVPFPTLKHLHINCHSFSFQQSNKNVGRILSVRIYYLLQLFSVLLQTFRPKKRFEPGTLRYSLHKQAQASLSSGINLRSVVHLPQGEDPNDWIAVHGKLTPQCRPLYVV